MSLPRYSGTNVPCPKCGVSVVASKYRKDVDMMRRVCATCGYEWNELPLDRASRMEFETRVERMNKRAQTD